jgi:hypothetical protein
MRIRASGNPETHSFWHQNEKETSLNISVCSKTCRSELLNGLPYLRNATPRNAYTDTHTLTFSLKRLLKYLDIRE